MPNHDPADPVTSGAGASIVGKDGAPKVPKVTRKRSGRTPAVSGPGSMVPIEAPAMSAGVTDRPGVPTGALKSLVDAAGKTLGMRARPSTAAGAPKAPVGAALLDGDVPGRGVARLVSAITPDERELEAILNSLMPVVSSEPHSPIERRMVPVTTQVPVSAVSELERPTLALRPPARVLPAAASSSVWIRSDPVATSPPAGPPVVGPRPRLLWRRIP